VGIISRYGTTQWRSPSYSHLDYCSTNLNCSFAAPHTGQAKVFNSLNLVPELVIVVVIVAVVVIIVVLERMKKYLCSTTLTNHDILILVIIIIITNKVVILLRMVINISTLIKRIIK